jgi:hypothetical protein
MVEVKQVPIDPDEEGIIVLTGISEAAAKELIYQLRGWLANREKEPVAFLWLEDPEASVEFVKVSKKVWDVKLDDKSR